jgi:hypothetical protein
MFYCFVLGRIKGGADCIYASQSSVGQSRTKQTVYRFKLSWLYFMGLCEIEGV